MTKLNKYFENYIKKNWYPVRVTKIVKTPKGSYGLGGVKINGENQKIFIRGDEEKKIEKGVFFLEETPIMGRKGYFTSVRFLRQADVKKTIKAKLEFGLEEDVKLWADVELSSGNKGFLIFGGEELLSEAQNLKIQKFLDYVSSLEWEEKKELINISINLLEGDIDSQIDKEIEIFQEKIAYIREYAKKVESVYSRFYKGREWVTLEKRVPGEVNPYTKKRSSWVEEIIVPKNWTMEEKKELWELIWLSDENCVSSFYKKLERTHLR